MYNTYLIDTSFNMVDNNLSYYAAALFSCLLSVNTAGKQAHVFKYEVICFVFFSPIFSTLPVHKWGQMIYLAPFLSFLVR